MSFIIKCEPDVENLRVTTEGKKAKTSKDSRHQV
jgi:hypothetical protein